MSNIFGKRQFFTKNQYFYLFLPYFHWKKCSFVTEPHFLILRLMKDLKTFSRVKLAENYTHGRIFEKNYSKKVKNAKFGQNAQFLAKNGQNRTFLKMGPDRRIPELVFWIQHTIASYVYNCQLQGQYVNITCISHSASTCMTIKDLSLIHI